MRGTRERRRPLQSMRPSIPAPCVLAAASVVGVFAGEWLHALIPSERLLFLAVGGAVLVAGVLAVLFLKQKNLVHSCSSALFWEWFNCLRSIMRAME